MRFTTCWPIVLALAGFTWILPAGGAVFTVDTTADDASLSNCQDDIAADCSLRGAIARANGVAEPSTIFVPWRLLARRGRGLPSRDAPARRFQHQHGFALL